MLASQTSIWELFPSHPDLIKELATRLNCPEIVAQCLLNRGVTSLQEAQSFLDPMHMTVDYFDQDAFSAAADCIIDAIATHKKIFLYGDYDVDGMSSTAMMYLTLKSLNVPVEFYIPKRVSEGYGLNQDWIHTLVGANPDILITLDCGISDVTEIAMIKQQLPNCKVIVFDHHQIPDQIPNADVIINPQLQGKTHPATILCTAGIVSLFLRYLQQEKKLPFVDLQMDLAAMGTVADVVPLKGVNRRITIEGLQLLSKRKNRGLKALMMAAKLDRPMVSATDIGFVLGPRLNAAGRLADPRLGVKLLTANTEEDAYIISQKLTELNSKRQLLGQQIFEEAKKMIRADQRYQDSNIIVLSNLMWHPGVIGVIASKLVNEYHKPTVLIAQGDTSSRGSARSVPGVSIYQVLKECEGLMSAFGGHHAAAGFDIENTQILAFQEALHQVAGQHIDAQQLRKIFEVDAQLEFEDISLALAKALHQLAPFGQGNPEPLFYFRDLQVLDAKCVGKAREHLKLTLSSADQKRSVDAIGFSMGKQIEKVVSNRNIDILCHLQINEWMERELPQLQIVDIR